MHQLNLQPQKAEPEDDLNSAVLPIKDPSKCSGCPYPSVGFICWSSDGSCLKTHLDKMHGKKKDR